jgi:hypothetical protein
VCDKYGYKNSIDPLLLHGSSDPHLVNELIYKYSSLKQRDQNFRFKLYSTVNGIIKVVNNFKKKEKQFKGFNTSLCKAIITNVYRHGFFIEDTVYRGAKGMIFGVEQGGFSFAKEQTLQDRINYIKIAFQPCSSHNFIIETTKLPKDLKSRINVFLLSLHRWSKSNFKFKVPKPLVKNCILNQLGKYCSAQQMRPIFLEQIELCKQTRLEEEVEKTIQFFCNDFMQWFDQEALR